MAYVFTGENPSQLYFDSSMILHSEGNVLSPRGKKVKELRPAIFEFTNPLNRVTFVKGRKINPFFQLAEGLWILLGRADVEWLEKYNKNMKNFSDDGVYFNAPYGERLRFWGRNLASGEVFNPIDQLYDAYLKLKDDKDTRQAFASIGDPRYDHYAYLKNGGKDIACNREFTFKIRDNKLDITVFNRSNDLSWGLFGANLNQFATIQEMMASWLGLEVGTYTHISDSLHEYLEDYGYKAFLGICEAYGVDKSALSRGIKPIHEVKQFSFEDEPRMSKLEPGEFDELLRQTEYLVETLIHDDDNYMSMEVLTNVINIVSTCTDKYLRMILLAMVAYRSHRLGTKEGVFTALGLMQDSSWKVSCLYFLYNSYKEEAEYQELFEHYPEEMKAYIKGE